MARSSTTIPPSLQAGLRGIATLTEDQFRRLLTSLTEIPTEIVQYQVFPEIDVPGGRAVLNAAYSLILGRSRPRSPIDEAVDSVLLALESAGFDKELLTTLRPRAEAILQIDTLDLLARAHDVMLEHSFTYSTARVVSDIRGVFGDDVSSPPQAAVIVHMLNMMYHNAGRRESLAIALDEKDIDQLIAVLERARAKNNVLRETITASGIKYIGVS